jgi:hypothetical protein
LRPSGLQASHIDSLTGICVPHRTQPCVGSGAAVAAEAWGAVGDVMTPAM